jgi:hypothetical protein
MERSRSGGEGGAPASTKRHPPKGGVRAPPQRRKRKRKKKEKTEKRKKQEEEEKKKKQAERRQRGRREKEEEQEETSKTRSKRKRKAEEGEGEEGKSQGRTTPDRKGVTHHGLLGVSLPPVFPYVSVSLGELQGA